MPTRRVRSLAASLLALSVVAVVPGRAATIDIVRDKWGVPHVFVPPSLGGKIAQLKALSFAQGYATAQDRLASTAAGSTRRASPCRRVPAS